MAQVTTNLKSMRDAVIEYSTDNTTWTDISGYSSNVTFAGGDRASGEAYTYEGDTAVVGFGKRAPTETTVSVVYSESGSDIAGLAWNAYINKTPWYLRLTPKGDNAGNNTWTSAAGELTSCLPPMGEASSGDPVMMEFTHRCSGYTEAARTT